MKRVVLLVIAAVVFITAAAGTRAQIAMDADSALFWKTLPYQYGVKGEIINAVYSPDETKIIVTTTEKWCELDAETGAFIRMLPDSIRGLKMFTEGGKYFLSYYMQKVSYPDMKVVGRFLTPPDLAKNGEVSISSFDVNAEANVVIGYIWRGQEQPLPKISLVEYDYTTFQEIKRNGLEGNYMRDVKISPKGDYFITQSHYNPDLSTDSENRWVCTQWDVKTLEPIKELPQLELPTAFIELLAFSDDGSKIACASDSKVDIYNSAIQLIDSYQLNRQERIGLDFSNDSKFLVAGEMWAGGMLNSVCRMNIEKRIIDYRFNFNLDTMAVHRVRLNASGDRILTSSSSNVSQIKIGTASTFEQTYEQIVSPNPTNGIVSFVLNNFEGKLKISVIDSRGKEIISQERFTALNEIITLDLSTLGNGVYFINCSDLERGKKIQTLKLIKE